MVELVFTRHIEKIAMKRNQTVSWNFGVENDRTRSAQSRWSRRLLDDFGQDVAFPHDLHVLAVDFYVAAGIGSIDHFIPYGYRKLATGAAISCSASSRFTSSTSCVARYCSNLVR